MGFSVWCPSTINHYQCYSSRDTEDAMTNYLVIKKMRFLLAFAALLMVSTSREARSLSPNPPFIVSFGYQDATVDKRARQVLSLVVDAWRHRVPRWRGRGCSVPVQPGPTPQGAIVTTYPEGFEVAGEGHDAPDTLQHDIQLGDRRASAIITELASMGVPLAALHLKPDNANALNGGRGAVITQWWSPNTPQQPSCGRCGLLHC